MNDRKDIVPIVAGLAGLVLLAFCVGGCGALHVAYDETGKASSLSLKVADAAPTPEEAPTASESVANTVDQIDEAGAAVLNSRLVQTGIGILTGGSVLGGVGAWASSRARKDERGRQEDLKSAEDRGWDMREREHIAGSARIIGANEAAA